MDSCCSANPDEAERRACPECGAPGRSVERITLKALLRPAALAQLAPAAYRFCVTPTCGVVYFSAASVFRRAELLVPVFQKEPPGSRTVCYCFGIAEGDVRREIAETGVSTASARISALVQAERCACEVRNPQGVCCLGNLVAVEKAAIPRADGEMGSLV